MTDRLRHDESGFTLVELLTAMTIGIVVLLAAFLLLDRATSVSQEIANRQDATQRGRQAMELIVRDLRSQVCLGDETEPITSGDANQVTFYADLSDGTGQVERRTIRYDSIRKALFEDIHVGSGTYPELVFDAVPTETRNLLSGIEPIVDPGGPRPILRYYGFRPGGAPGDLERLGASAEVTPDEAIRIVMVKVGFVVLPDRTHPRDRDATTFESDVYVRLADPSTPAEGPPCI